MLVDFNVRGQQGMDFLTWGSIIVDFGLVFWLEKKQMMDLLLHKTFIDGLELWVLLVDYCDVFISCLDSHSDGTHSLQRIYWWASAVMLNFTQSGLLKKQAHLHLGWPGWAKFQQIFISGWITLSTLNSFCVMLDCHVVMSNEILYLGVSGMV